MLGLQATICVFSENPSPQYLALVLLIIKL